MDESIRQLLTDIHSTDRSLQNQAYQALMQATDSTVDWAYEAWEGLLHDLKHRDNHVRSIAGQLLSNLAKSDPAEAHAEGFRGLAGGHSMIQNSSPPAIPCRICGRWARWVRSSG